MNPAGTVQTRKLYSQGVFVMNVFMRCVLAQLWILVLLALASPVGAESWIVQIPVQTADGREIMLPLSLNAAAAAQQRDLAEGPQVAGKNFQISSVGFTSSLFPPTD